MRVARAFGRDPHDVAAEPFARTAWSYLELVEAERLDGLARDADALMGASLTAMAFHDPKRLDGARRDLLARMRTVSTPDALARGQRIMAAIDHLPRAADG